MAAAADVKKGMAVARQRRRVAEELADGMRVEVGGAFRATYGRGTILVPIGMHGVVATVDSSAGNGMTRSAREGSAPRTSNERNGSSFVM